MTQPIRPLYQQKGGRHNIPESHQTVTLFHTFGRIIEFLMGFSGGDPCALLRHRICPSFGDGLEIERQSGKWTVIYPGKADRSALG